MAKTKIKKEASPFGTYEFSYSRCTMADDWQEIVMIRLDGSGWVMTVLVHYIVEEAMKIERQRLQREEWQSLWEERQSKIESWFPKRHGDNPPELFDEDPAGIRVHVDPVYGSEVRYSKLAATFDDLVYDMDSECAVGGAEILDDIVYQEPRLYEYIQSERQLTALAGDDL